MDATWAQRGDAIDRLTATRIVDTSDQILAFTAFLPRTSRGERLSKKE